MKLNVKLNYNHGVVHFPGVSLHSEMVEEYKKVILKIYEEAGMEEPAFMISWNGTHHRVEVRPPPPAGAPIRRLANAWQEAKQVHKELVKSTLELMNDEPLE